jgi:hypothetical protein
MDSAEELISAIEAAFAGVPRGAITLHEAEVMDSYGLETERRAARAHDPEEDWRAVPDTSIEECPAALSFVDPLSWRFYLPAFMRLGLRDFKSSRDATIDLAIYALDRGDNPNLADFKLKRFQTLTEEQSRVVRRFLAFAAEQDDYCDSLVAKNALLAHWGRFS